MQSSLDTFRAQREAADQIQGRLTEVSQLLNEVQSQVDALAGERGPPRPGAREQNWLRQAQKLLADVRYFREQERLRFWPGVWRQWVLAVLFALASAAAAGVWWTEQYAPGLKELRTRAELADTIAARMATMTQAERRQFDTLMKLRTPVH